MTVTSDAELIRLTAQPAEKLFPSLQRAEAFDPLVLLLILLPGLFAVSYAPLTEQAALWNLRALNRFIPLEQPLSEQSASLEAIQEVELAPPLGSRLAALTLRAFGTQRLWMYLLPSLIATCGLLGALFYLIRDQGDPRASLLTVVLLSLHGPFLLQHQTPEPVSLTLLLGIGACGCAWRHFQRSLSPFSWWLLPAGLLLGLASLSGGLISLAFLLVIVSYQIFRPKLIVSEDDALFIRRGLSPRETVYSLLIIAGLMLLSGGWWPIRETWRHGGSWLLHWFQLDAFATVSLRIRVPAMVTRFLQLQGSLLGLTLLGIIWAFRVFRRTEDNRLRATIRWLQVWYFTALGFWCFTLLGAWDTESFSVHLSRGFLLLPSVLFAVFCVLELADRKLSGRAFLFASLATLAWVYGVQLVREEAAILQAMVILSMILICLTGYLYASGTPEFRTEHSRSLLSLAVLTMAFTHGALGLAQVTHSGGPNPVEKRKVPRPVRAAMRFIPRDENDRALKLLSQELRHYAEVRHCVVVSQKAPPPEIQFFLQSLWPGAELTFHSGWDSVVAAGFRVPDSRGLPPREVFVAWNTKQTRPVGLQPLGSYLHEIAKPQFYRDVQFRVFVLELPGDRKIDQETVQVD